MNEWNYNSVPPNGQIVLIYLINHDIRLAKQVPDGWYDIIGRYCYENNSDIKCWKGIYNWNYDLKEIIMDIDRE